MRAAERAVRNFGDEAERAANRARVSFEIQRGAADRLERELRRLMETQRQQSEQTRRQSEQTRRNSDETRRNSDQTRRNSDETRRNTNESNRSAASTMDRTDAIISLSGAAGILAGEAVAAGVALGAFGAVAAPAIYKVVAASFELSDRWSTLSGEQQVSAMLVRGLADDYKNLARSYEPQALSAFNSVVSTARGLLPQLGKVVDATSYDVLTLANRITDFLSGRVGGEFLTWAGQQAPRALGLLGDNLVVAGDTALDLLQDIAPLGIGLLQLTHGTLSAVNAVASMNPILAQLAVSALLLRAPVAGLIGGFGRMAGRAREFSAANRGASLATRALNLVTAAGPALFVAAGVGLGFLVLKMASMKTETDRVVSSMQIQNRAMGNNLAGHQAQARFLESQFVKALRHQAEVQAQVNEEEARSGQQRRELKGQSEAAQRAVDAASASLDKQQSTIIRLNTASDLLATKYRVTREQAQRMADAAGVDLSNALQKNGTLTDAAAKKIEQYRLAVELANDPMKQITLALQDAGNKALTMKDRVTALTAAFDAQFNPSIAVYQAMTQLREGFRTLSDQMVKAKGNMTGSSAASLALRNAFQQQLVTVKGLHAATLQKTGSLQTANTETAKYLPILYAYAGRNREARAQVDALARATGFNIGQTLLSRQAFVTQATAMTGSRVRAEELWRSYQRLTGATNAGSTAVNTYIARVRAQATAAQAATARTHGAAAAQGAFNVKVRDALPVLYALAGRNAQARAQVDALARSTGHSTGAANANRSSFLRAASAMGIAKDRAAALWKELLKIKDRDAHVNVTAKGSWHAKQMQQGYAKGGRVWSSEPGASQAYDSVPSMLRLNEHVWTPEEVAAVGGHGAMYRMRAMAKAGQLNGYARGGKVSFSHDRRSTPKVVDDVVAPINLGIFGMVAAIAKLYAAQYKKMMSGGSIVAAARSQIGVPYSWGGGGPGGPSRGIGRGAGTVGFDCSGLTEYAWWRGRRMSIGGTTYTQWPNSNPSPRRPGALGFPHMGHVVLASNKPGYIIEAPFTGGHVREVRSSRGYSWRWPGGAGKAEGGPVTEQDRRIGRRFVDASGGPIIVEAKTLQIAGDPGGMGIPGYAGGGWVRGRAGHDKVVMRGTAGEFMVNRHAAGQHPRLVEALNAGRVGEAMVRPTIRASAGVLSGASGGGSGRGGGGIVIERLVLENHGAIGSRIEMQNWLASGLEDLRKQGRLPVQPSGRG
jgi:hypothetical protein